MSIAHLLAMVSSIKSQRSNQNAPKGQLLIGIVDMLPDEQATPLRYIQFKVEKIPARFGKEPQYEALLTLYRYIQLEGGSTEMLAAHIPLITLNPEQAIAKAFARNGDEPLTTLNFPLAEILVEVLVAHITTCLLLSSAPAGALPPYIENSLFGVILGVHTAFSMSELMLLNSIKTKVATREELKNPGQERDIRPIIVAEVQAHLDRCAKQAREKYREAGVPIPSEEEINAKAPCTSKYKYTNVDGVKYIEVPENDLPDQFQEATLWAYNRENYKLAEAVDAGALYQIGDYNNYGELYSAYRSAGGILSCLGYGKFSLAFVVTLKE